MHCGVDEQARVQRFDPLGYIDRQRSGAAHSPSAKHRSSSCLPVPPLLVEDEDDDTVDDVVLPPPDELVVGPAPTLLEVIGAPPVPLLLVEVASPGTHCALMLQMYPLGQSRAASTQLSRHEPSKQ
ncbi:Hypothetical protein A7982_05862 [Minicystis rosea]|nr:Hypothetical protein A7982_05862 [Minicystis rosea]